MSCAEAGSGIDLSLGGGGLGKAPALPAEGYGASSWGDGNVLGVDGADGCATW